MSNDILIYGIDRRSTSSVHLYGSLSFTTMQNVPSRAGVVVVVVVRRRKVYNYDDDGNGDESDGAHMMICLCASR